MQKAQVLAEQEFKAQMTEKETEMKEILKKKLADKDTILKMQLAEQDIEAKHLLSQKLAEKEMEIKSHQDEQIKMLNAKAADELRMKIAQQELTDQAVLEKKIKDL